MTTYQWHVCPECSYETIFPDTKTCLRCGKPNRARPLSLLELRERGLARDPDEQAIAAEDKPRKKRWYKK